MLASSGRAFNIILARAMPPVAYGLNQSTDGHAIDISLQLWPAIEPVTARDDELRIVQRKRRKLRIVVECGDFVDCRCVGRPESGEQFFRLSFELFEVRAPAHPAHR